MKDFHTYRACIFRLQQGYFLLLAVLFILVIGFMGVVMSYMFASRAALAVAQQNGNKTFYIAESALEIASRLLTMPSLSGTPSRITCGSITGNASITNATLGSGTFTVTTTNSSPVFASTTLSAPTTASANTLSLTSASGFAPRGRVTIDNEAIDYTTISGNNLMGVSRGRSGTTASSHASGAGVGQFQCSLDAIAGIPDLITPNYQRELQWNVELQDGWVVANNSGSNFIISRWNRSTEKSWNSLSVAGGTNATVLNGVSMLSNADGWAVGNIVSSNLIFLHWTGTSWQLVTVAGCTGQNLLDVSMVSSQEGWAAGAQYKASCSGGGKSRYNIMKWNGSTWTALSPSSSPSVPADSNSIQDINAVHVIDNNQDGIGDVGFAVGNSGQILQYNGTAWITNVSPTNKNLFKVYVVSASEAWAVGASGTILKWNGSSWNTFTSPTTTQLNAIAMIDSDGNGTADAGWIAANTGQIYSYNGTSWSLATTIGSTNFLSVSIINEKDVWVAGAGGVIDHWDGSTWASVNSGVTQQINASSFIYPPKSPVSVWQQIFH